jgi:2-polyprenyl-3-methyl-5-hydroxy-6-metoxy-1,4-benzoquinol methylase
MTNTDRAWTKFGEADPYHAVLTKDTFQGDRFDAAARAEFFESGERYVDWVLDVVRDRLDKDYQPDRILDFGCGVGRLTIPLARRAQEAVGVDISPGMLQEARANVEHAGISNATFVMSNDTLSRVIGSFNLVHAFIVMQHIAPDRGFRLLARFVDLLDPDGIGIIHVTYANARRTPLARRLVTTAYERVPLAYNLRNVAKRQPFNSPSMHMHRYDLNEVFRLLQEAECHDVHVRFTEASHYNHPIYGTILFFKKRGLDTTRFS